MCISSGDKRSPDFFPARTTTTSNTITTQHEDTLPPRNMKYIGWCFFLIAECYILQLHHNFAVYNNTNNNIKSSSRRSSSHKEILNTPVVAGTEQEEIDTNTIYSLFEQELIHQGIQLRGQSSNSNNRHDITSSSSSSSNTTTGTIVPKQRPQPDGTFNGYPIYNFQQDEQSQSNVLYSQYHCMGESWDQPILKKQHTLYYEQSWMHRSCKFELLCYHTSTQEYAIFLNPDKHTPVAGTTTTMTTTTATPAATVAATTPATPVAIVSAASSSSLHIQKLVGKQQYQQQNEHDKEMKRRHEKIYDYYTTRKDNNNTTMTNDKLSMEKVLEYAKKKMLIQKKILQMKNDNIDNNKNLHEKTVKENDNIDNEEQKILALLDLEEKPLIKVYKTPSYFDDTSTIYQNGTVIVDSNGYTTIDQYWNGPKINMAIPVIV